MRWRPVAAAAAGVVAAVGLGSHRAAADTGGEGADPTSTTTPTRGPNLDTRSARLEEAAALSDLAQSLPPPPTTKKPPVAPPELDSAVSTVVAALPPVLTGDGFVPRLPADFALHVVAQPAGSHPRPHGNTAAARNAMSAEAATAANRGASPAASAPSAAPADDRAPTSTAPSSPPVYATSTGANTNTAAPNLPPSAGTTAGAEHWWPTWAGDLVDQRLATAWRSNPVRGPPPGTASALGNDGRTTIYQVSVVKGKDGTKVSISASQTAVVNNVGLAQADAIGSGSASATGDQARTSIYQTTVVVQRGTGTATVEQAAHVDNFGVALAASAGSGTASAVGNASSTSVSQTAVVLLLGSGDAQVRQAADVTNAGGGSAVATDTDSSAVGTTATTDVSQIAVLVVHDDDMTVNQTSSTTNTGGGFSTGGTATGNASTNTTSQVDVQH